MASVSEPVTFREFCPLYYLLNAIPTKIQKGFRSLVVYLTALDTNGDYIAVGSSIGMLYLYCRQHGQMRKYNFEVGALVCPEPGPWLVCDAPVSPGWGGASELLPKPGLSAHPESTLQLPFRWSATKNAVFELVFLASRNPALLYCPNFSVCAAEASTQRYFKREHYSV